MPWNACVSNISDKLSYWQDQGEMRIHVSYMFYATPGPSRGEVIVASGWYWYMVHNRNAAYYPAQGPYKTAVEAMRLSGYRSDQ